MHAIDLRAPVRAAHQDLVLGRVPGHRGEPTLQRTRRNRGDVVDESLGFHFRQFRSHVTADRDHMGAIFREDRIEYPVRRGPAEEHLLAAPGVDGTQGIVTTAERNQLTIGGPTGPVDRVECHRHRERELPGLRVPNLYFAHAGGQTPRHRQHCPIRRKADRFDAGRKADQPCDQGRLIDVVDQDLVIAGDGEQASVGGVVERGHDRR